MFLGEVFLLQSGNDQIAKSTIFRLNGSYIFFFKKRVIPRVRGNTELKSLCIICRLMLIDIRFIKISYTVIEII